MTKKFTRENGYTENDLIHYAVDHIVSAQCLYHFPGARGVDSAGYLSHLGIELLLKAQLLNYCGYFTDEHSLCALYEQLPNEKQTLSPEHRDLLSKWDKLFQLRYPNPHSPIPAGTHHWNEAKGLSQALVNLMPEALHETVRRYGVDPPLTKGGRRLYNI